MLSGITKLLPDAEVGFLGIKRNEETLQPETYANRLPVDLARQNIILVDPMLATDGTLNDSIDYALSEELRVQYASAFWERLRVSKQLASTLQKKWPENSVSIHLAALDEKLNEIGYIIPGLGDAVDRLFGIT